MKTNKITNRMAGTAYRKAARIAGIFFILNLIVPLFNWTFVLSKFSVPDNVLATANNIMENESLFRFGITVELFMAVGLIVLALFLYRMLKPINKNLALLALSLKLVEATLMAVTVLIPFVALQFSNGEVGLTAFTPEQLKSPIGLIFNSHTAITSVPMVFLGLDMMIFSYLFLKSRYIPRILAGFGILSFALIFIHATMYILAPEYAVMPINQIIFWTPSGLFEIMIGIWLIAKGSTNQKLPLDQSK
jgi:hypothetical protein